jgi:hypothetical protein
MKQIFALFGLLAICSFSTFAQGRPLVEVSGGYTFQRWDVPTFVQPPSTLNYSGFNVGAAFHPINWVALAREITGTYNSQNGADTKIFSYLAGPGFYPLGHHKLTPYGHALFGVATLHLPGNIPTTEGKFSFAIGGGLD